MFTSDSVVQALMSVVVSTNLPTILNHNWKVAVNKCFDHLVNSQFDERGVHTENYPEYHLFVLRLFDELYNSGWYEKFEDEMEKVFELARDISSWMRLTDGRVLPIGDGNAKLSLTQSKKIIAKSALKNVNVNIFMHHLYSIIKIIRDNDTWSCLAVKSGHIIDTHRHKDDMSFL